MEIFRLFGSIFVETDQATRNMNQLNTHVESGQSKFKGLMSTLADFGLAMNAVSDIFSKVYSASTSLFTLAEKTSDYGSEIVDLSAKIGMSTDSFQQWKYVVENAGVEMSVFQGGFKKFNGVLDDASKDKEKRAVFDNLGISITNVNGKLKPTEELFNKAITALQKMPEGANKAALAADLFGKSSTELGSILNGTSKDLADAKKRAVDLGLVMSGESLTQMDNFGDTLQDLKKSFSAVGMMIGMEVIPVFQKMINWAIANMPQIRSLVGNAFDYIKGIALDVYKVFNDKVLPIFKYLYDTVKQNMPQTKSTFKDSLGLIKEIAGEVYDIFNEKVLPVFKELYNYVKQNIPQIKKFFKEEFETIKSIVLDVYKIFKDNYLPTLKELYEYIKQNMPKIKQFFHDSFGVMAKVIDGIIDSIKSLTKFMEKYWDVLEPIFVGIAAGLVTMKAITVAQAAWTAAVAAWAVVGALATTVTTAFGVALAFATSPIGIVVLAIGALVAVGVLLYNNWDIIKEKAALLWGYLKAFAGKVVQYGKDIVFGLWNGISDMGQWIKDKVLGFVGGIGKTITDFFGIHSPSKLTEGYGKNIVEGLANGILDNAQAAGEAALEMSRVVISNLDKLESATIKALKTKYSAEEKLQEDSINKQMQRLKTATDMAISQYNREYEAKMKKIAGERDPKLKALQTEIDNINKLTDVENEALKEKEYNAEITKLKAELLAADTADKKLSIQKELDQKLADHAREAELASRNARIEAIRVQMEDVNAAALKKEEQAKIELEKQKAKEKLQQDMNLAFLQSKLDSTKKHYEQLNSEESIQAEVRRLALQANNTELINVLQAYNPKWQDAGQSFGESLLNGLNSTKTRIQSAVQSIMSMVNSTQSAQNQVILQAQQAWNQANAIGDKVAMDKAHSIAESARAAGGGTTVNINSPNLFNDKDADKLGDLIVTRLRVLGVK